MSDETTTQMLAETEAQAEYTPPEGWRLLQVGEVIETGDKWVRPDDREAFTACRIGQQVHGRMRYIRRMEQQPEQQPEPEPEPEDCGFEGKILREQPQPVQIREGRWRTRGGDVRNVTPTPSVDSMADIFPWHDAAGRRHRQLWRDDGKFINGVQEHGDDLVKYLGPIESEPEQTITPDDVAPEALAGVNEWPSVQTLRQKLEATELALLEQQQRNEQLVTQGSQQCMEIAELQAQVRFLKNRELTLGTRLEEEKAVTTKRLDQIQELRSEVSHVQRLWGESRRRVEELEQQMQDKQEPAIPAGGGLLRDVSHYTEMAETDTPDADVSAEQQIRTLQEIIEAQAETIARLHSEVHGLNMEIAEQQKAVNGTGAVNDVLRQQLEAILADWELQAKTISGLQTQLEAVKAESAKRLEQVEELRSEVSHVQGLWGESRRRVEELETLVADLRVINAAQEKAVNAAGRENTDLQHRLDVVSKEWAEQAATINGLRAQLEAVKAELVQQAETSRRLQIELDAAQQVPQAVSYRFEEGWDAGNARAVETIAEWTEPFRTCGSQGLSYHVMQNLPHIMRSLTGLADED